MKIYLVRHGETNMNKNRILQGSYDEPLNEDGINLAKISGKGLIGIHFDEAFSSPLNRSFVTVRSILDESENEATEIRMDERLKEVNLGDWTLSHIDDISNPYHDSIKLFFKDPFSLLSIPNGENVFDVMKRTQEFLKELIKRNDDRTYLVGTHGFAMRAMLNMFYEDKEDFWHGHVPYNCCFNIIEVKDGIPSLVQEDICYYHSEIKDFYK